MTILVLDADPLVRASVARALRPIAEVVTAATAAELATWLRRGGKPSAALLEPGRCGDGVELARRLRARHPDIPVALLGAVTAEPIEGVDVIPKGEPATWEAIFAFARQPRVRRGAAARREALVDSEALRLAATAKLSARELEVFRRIAQGERAPEITRGLSIGTATFRTYAHHIYAKLGVDDAEHARIKVWEAVIERYAERGGRARPSRSAAGTPLDVRPSRSAKRRRHAR